MLDGSGDFAIRDHAFIYLHMYSILVGVAKSERENLAEQGKKPVPPVGRSWARCGEELLRNNLWAGGIFLVTRREPPRDQIFGAVAAKSTRESPSAVK
jgi:hypothetical protein